MRPPAAPAPAAPAAGVAQLRSNPRITALRRRMLALTSAAIAFGLLVGVIGWQANAATYTAYHTLVDEDSVSVDAALLARAAVLDHMGAAATYLATTGSVHDAANARAQTRWADYNTQSRVSWRNVTDAVQGEGNVFAAADQAASDYIQQIGAMYAFYAAKQTAPASAAFLAARETLNARLVPALTGLEGIKVEDMAATYAGADTRITRWRWALVGVAAILALIFLAGLLAVRRMHYAWSWSLGLALLVTVGLTVWMQDQLGRASADSQVLVSDAYATVAGVQDLSASLSQARALESIAIFDPAQAATHLSSFDQYNFLVEQTLCGPTDCTETTFLAGADTIDPAVAQRARAEQAKLGLPRTPLIANVHFAGQAAQFEALRVAYRHWLDLHRQLAAQLTSGQVDAARTLSTGASDAAFTQVVQNADTARNLGRGAFDAIWQRVYTVSLLNEVLAVAFVLAGLLAAVGLVRRRSELFV